MEIIHVEFKADNFKVNKKEYGKANLIDSFKSDLTKSGISKSIVDILEIDINIDNKFPRKIHFDIKISNDEYYYSDSLSYIDLTTRYTPEAYVIAHKVAAEFIKDLQEYIDDYIKQIGTDASNLPTNISFLEAYEFIFNNVNENFTLPWNTRSIEFDKSNVKFVLRNSAWDPNTYLVFDKINREFFYHVDNTLYIFNPLKIDIDILNSDKWSVIEYKSG